MTIIMGQFGVIILVFLVNLTLAYIYPNAYFSRISPMFAKSVTENVGNFRLWALSEVHCISLCMKRKRYSQVAYSETTKDCKCFEDHTDMTNLDLQADTHFFNRMNMNLGM